MTPQKVLIIQTAFLGDVILATGLIEKIKAFSPGTSVDFLLKKGNESILHGNPNIKNVFIFDKKKRVKNLLKLIRKIRREKYDLVVNLHRFASSGLIAGLSGAKEKIGFDKNPLSFCYTEKYKHEIGTNGVHEIERNDLLIKKYFGDGKYFPRMYPGYAEKEKVGKYKAEPYVCIAPGSVWFTKRWPMEKWVELINNLPSGIKVYLLGAPGELELCESIKSAVIHPGIKNLAGALSITESASLMEDARMNYVNDSAPLHIASAMNAPVTAVFCSTVPEFGFGPLSEKSYILETDVDLSCRPCGLHGKKACPEGHFKCAHLIEFEGNLEMPGKP